MADKEHEDIDDILKDAGKGYALLNHQKKS